MDNEALVTFRSRCFITAAALPEARVLMKINMGHVHTSADLSENERAMFLKLFNVAPVDKSGQTGDNSEVSREGNNAKDGEL